MSKKHPLKHGAAPTLLAGGVVYHIDHVERSVRATIDSLGKNPKSADGAIEFGPLRRSGLTWSDVDSSLKAGGAFQKLGYKGLSDFQSKRKIHSTLRTMFMNCAQIAFIGKSVPSLHQLDDVKTYKYLKNVDTTLREGKIHGWGYFMPDVKTVPATLDDFCKATGLVEERDGKLSLPAPVVLLDAIGKFISKP